MLEGSNMEKKIMEILDQIAKDPDNNHWTDKKWSFRIKSEIAKIGKQQHFWVYGAQAENVDDGEWLYDLVWLSYQGNTLINVNLLLESEWTPTNMYDDFQKLLLGRSELKVMIFYSSSVSHFKENINRMKNEIQSFKYSMPGDKYLLSGYVNEMGEFSHENYIHKNL